MVSRDSPRALQWEWRAAPEPDFDAGGSGKSSGASSRSAAGASSGAANRPPTPPGRSGSSGSGSGGKGSASAPPGGIPEAVAAALKAKDYYEVLGIPEADQFKLDDASVRRCYLKTSVKVHPDKHPSCQELATQAFQKVSEAYGALQDEDGRARYAAELRSSFGKTKWGGGGVSDGSDSDSDSGGGGGVGRGSRRGGTARQQGRGDAGVSMREAAAFFAAAVAAEMAMGHIHMPSGVAQAMGGVGDAMEFAAAMKMAEQLAQGGGGSTANRFAAGMMVANAGAKLSGRLGALGGPVGRLGAGLGGALRLGTTVAAIGSIAVAAHSMAIERRASEREYYDEDERGAYGSEQRRGPRPQVQRPSKPPMRHYPDETDI